jgi:hypothetical protein
VASNRFEARPDPIATGTSAETLQLVAAANHAILAGEWSISFDGTGNTAQPIRVDVLRQSTAGSTAVIHRDGVVRREAHVHGLDERDGELPREEGLADGPVLDHGQLAMISAERDRIVRQEDGNAQGRADQCGAGGGGQQHAVLQPLQPEHRAARRPPGARAVLAVRDVRSS